MANYEATPIAKRLRADYEYFMEIPGVDSGIAFGMLHIVKELLVEASNPERLCPSCFQKQTQQYLGGMN